MEKLMRMEETIRENEIKGQKLYNKGMFEQAKKIWARGNVMKAKLKSLKCNMQIRI